MKNRSVTYRKTMKTLPLVEDPAELWRGGGREQGGGERLDGQSEKTQETLYGYRGAFMDASQRQIDGSSFVVNNGLAAMLWIL